MDGCLQAALVSECLRHVSTRPVSVSPVFSPRAVTQIVTLRVHDTRRCTQELHVCATETVHFPWQHASWRREPDKTRVGYHDGGGLIRAVVSGSHMENVRCRCPLSDGMRPIGMWPLHSFLGRARLLGTLSVFPGDMGPHSGISVQTSYFLPPCSVPVFSGHCYLYRYLRPSQFNFVCISL